MIIRRVKKNGMQIEVKIYPMCLIMMDLSLFLVHRGSRIHEFLFLFFRLHFSGQLYRELYRNFPSMFCLQKMKENKNYCKVWNKFPMRDYEYVSCKIKD